MTEVLFSGPKIGGSSMVLPDQVKESLAVRSAQDGINRCLVIVSAPGVLPHERGIVQKTTDNLYAYANLLSDGLTTEAESKKEEIFNRFEEVYSTLGNKGIANLKNRLHKGFLDVPDDPELQYDYIASLGEEHSAFGYSMLTGARFIEPGILFGATGNLWRTRSIQKIAKLFRNGTLSFDEQAVMPGFYGFGPNGERFTLDRGGSDRTGAIGNCALGRVLGDKNVIYENLTDRPIHSADWRLIPDAKILRELKRRLIREGAHGGNPVLQGDTIVDLDFSEIITVVKSTFDVDDGGTRVIPDSFHYSDDYSGTAEYPVVAVSGRKLVEVHIDDLGMSNERGYLKRILGTAATLGLSVEHLPASQDYVTITLHEKADELKLSEFEEKLHRRSVNRNAKIGHNLKGVVYLVGEHLRDPLIKTKTLGRVHTLAADAGYALSDISDERSPSIAILTDPTQLPSIQKLLHNELIPN